MIKRELMVIKNGKVVTGDGKTILDRHSVIVEGELIKDVVESPDPSMVKKADIVIDARGKIVVPGMINHHTHGFIVCGLRAIALPNPPKGRVIEILNKHLLCGTTTLLNADPCTTWEAVQEGRRFTPINIKYAVMLCIEDAPKNLKSYESVRGNALTEEQKEYSLEEMLDLGAVAFGEIATHAGSGLDLAILPKVISEKFGMVITQKQALKLRHAILGKAAPDTSAFDYDETKKLLEQYWLDKVLTVEEARKLVEEALVPTYHLAVEAALEAASLAKKYDLPMILHNELYTKDLVLEISKLNLKLIAAHSNLYPSLEEAVSFAKKLKEYGVTIDVNTGDAFRRKYGIDSPEILFGMLKEGVVDTISTDYYQGFWDPMLLAMQEAVKQKVIDLPRAIALGTNNVAQAIPKLAPNRGFIAKGKIADVVISDEEQISEVDTVIIGGKIAVSDGKII